MLNESFKITSVHRDDFSSRGFDASKIDDSMMKRIASKMSDSYCECCFWVAIDYWGEELKMRKLDNNE